MEAVDDGDSAVRASLMATLASERYWGGDRESAFALSDDAVAMAQRLGDGRALVSALRGLLCAIGIQRALAANAEREGSPAVRVRIGLHVPPVADVPVLAFLASLPEGVSAIVIPGTADRQ